MASKTYNIVLTDEYQEIAQTLCDQGIGAVYGTSNLTIEQLIAWQVTNYLSCKQNAMLRSDIKKLSNDDLSLVKQTLEDAKAAEQVKDVTKL